MQTSKPRATYRPALARDEFLFKLFRTRNRIRFALDAVFKPLGVTDATWRVLFYLHRRGDGCMQKDLANEMGIEGPTLVRLLDRLEEQGLIQRQPAPHDRRGKMVYLTDGAEPVISQLQELSSKSLSSLLDTITDAEMETCVNVFDRLLNAIPEDNKCPRS